MDCSSSGVPARLGVPFSGRAAEVQAASLARSDYGVGGEAPGFSERRSGVWMETEASDAAAHHRLDGAAAVMSLVTIGLNGRNDRKGQEDRLAAARGTARTLRPQ